MMNFEKNYDQMDNRRVILYFMRHGQTIINKAGRVQGWWDGILTEEGVSVAENVARGLRNIKFNGVYSSDLGRAVKTAKIIIKVNKMKNRLKVKEVQELREIYFGKYEGQIESIMFKDIFEYLNVKSFEEASKIPDFGRVFVNACASLDETGTAENYEKLMSRTMNGIRKICEEILEYGGGNVLVVVHGGMLRNFLKEIDNNISVENIENSSISKVEYVNGNYNIVSINDMSYKEKGEKIKEMNK